MKYVNVRWAFKLISPWTVLISIADNPPNIRRPNIHFEVLNHNNAWHILNSPNTTKTDYANTQYGFLSQGYIEEILYQHNFINLLGRVSGALFVGNVAQEALNKIIQTKNPKSVVIYSKVTFEYFMWKEILVYYN